MERWPGTDLPWHRALTAGNPGQQCWEINRREGIPWELQSGEARLGYQRAEILWKCCLCPWEQGRADGITSEPCPGAQHGAGWAGGTGRVSETALKGPGRGEGMGNTQSSAGLAGNGQGLGQMCCVLCQMCSVLCPLPHLPCAVSCALPCPSPALQGISAITFGLQSWHTLPKAPPARITLHLCSPEPSRDWDCSF